MAPSALGRHLRQVGFNPCSHGSPWATPSWPSVIARRELPALSWGFQSLFSWIILGDPAPRVTTQMRHDSIRVSILVLMDHPIGGTSGSQHLSKVRLQVSILVLLDARPWHVWDDSGDGEGTNCEVSILVLMDHSHWATVNDGWQLGTEAGVSILVLMDHAPRRPRPGSPPAVPPANFRVSILVLMDHPGRRHASR